MIVLHTLTSYITSFLFNIPYVRLIKIVSISNK
nr:MAG TPA: hypothetical protein [Bacteriophage sp.]